MIDITQVLLERTGTIRRTEHSNGTPSFKQYGKVPCERCRSEIPEKMERMDPSSTEPQRLFLVTPPFVPVPRIPHIYDPPAYLKAWKLVSPQLPGARPYSLDEGDGVGSPRE